MKKNQNIRKRKIGPPPSVPPGKTRITIRIDSDVLASFRKQVHAAGGGNYQSSSTRCCDSMYSKLVNLLRKSFDA